MGVRSAVREMEHTVQCDKCKGRVRQKIVQRRTGSESKIVRLHMRKWCCSGGEV